MAAEPLHIPNKLQREPTPTAAILCNCVRGPLQFFNCMAPHPQTGGPGWAVAGWSDGGGWVGAVVARLKQAPKNKQIKIIFAFGTWQKNIN